MPKVLLATGIEQLDRDIAQELTSNGVDVAGECYYREGILPCCTQKRADTVIISPELAGSTNIEEIILSLRRSTLDIRVILLPGPEDLDDPRDLARSVLNAGVYDIVFSTPSSDGSKVNAKDVADRVHERVKYAEAEALLVSGVKILRGNMRERGSSSDSSLRTEADATEDNAGLTDVKEGERRDRNLGLPKLMQGVVDRISNRQKNAGDEPLPGDQGLGERLTWENEELWVPPVEKAGWSVKDGARDDWGIPTPQEELSRDAPVENTDEDVLSRDIENAGEDTTAAETARDGILDKKAAEEPVLDASTEKDSGWRESNNESLGGWEMTDEDIPENTNRDQVPEYQPIEPEAQQNTKQGLTFHARKTESEKSNMCYMPHQLIAVWSPDGWAKSYTAFNLAALAANKGFDTALINYDLLCPELDIWFDVGQTGIGDFEGSGAGVMTFGDGYEPKKISSFLKIRSWGIQYLPAGNKLGSICTPDLDTDVLEQTLKIIYQRNTRGKPAISVVDAGRSYEYAPTMAALRQAAIVLIPTDGSPALAEVTKQQIEELNRLGYSPRFIEVFYTTPGRKVSHICNERYSIAFDWNTYLIDRAAMKPACLRVDGRRAWEGVLNRLAPTGAGNVFRRM
jgi:hypothetical protein